MPVVTIPFDHIMIMTFGVTEPASDVHSIITSSYHRQISLLNSLSSHLLYFITSHHLYFLFKISLLIYQVALIG